MKTCPNINAAVHALRSGGVIAYPTEAVYGLGCDPFNSHAVFRLLGIKRRQPDKGLILIASDWAQIESLVKPIKPQLLSHIQSTWPGPNTWVFPASGLVPKWIRGKHDTVAVRISDHPIVRELCDRFCGPIVSTSANIESHPAKRDFRTASIAFENKVDIIVKGRTGGRKTPSTIRDAISGHTLRS